MRIIARLDIKNNYVIKGINLEGLRKVGDPAIFVARERFAPDFGILGYIRFDGALTDTAAVKVLTQA